MSKAFDLIATLRGVVHEIENDRVPYVYPTFETPASNEDLGKVFEHLNGRYWGGTLPRPVCLKFKPVAGEHSRTVVREEAVHEGACLRAYNVTISSDLRRSRVRVVDSLLTEMVKISKDVGSPVSSVVDKLVDDGFFVSRLDEAI